MSKSSPSNSLCIVGLSGGVDSAVSALLLQRQGIPIEGMFMKNWEEDDTDTYCHSQQDLQDVIQISNHLNINYHGVNFSKNYWDLVFEDFLAEIKKGRTPNPDILCNKHIKFKAFLEKAMSLGANTIATGHYANKRCIDGQYQLIKAKDNQKDQTYFLYTLGQKQLSASLFPLGNYIKSDVRKLALEAKLPVHSKKDSTGICFIGERHFNDFIKRYMKPNPGIIVDDNGRTLGEHQGLMFYTIGQRQGLGIGGIAGGSEKAWYVAEKNTDTNELLVVQGSSHPYLFHQSLQTKQLNWISGEEPEAITNCYAKIRYRQQEASCRIEKIADDHWQVHFKEPQRAVTLGQSIVFYHEDVCLGGGIIEQRG